MKTYTQVLQTIEEKVAQTDSEQFQLRKLISDLQADLEVLAEAPEGHCQTGTMNGRLSFQADHFNIHDGTVVFGIEIRFPIKSRCENFPIPVSLRHNGDHVLVNVQGGADYVLSSNGEGRSEGLRGITQLIMSAIENEVEQWIRE